MAGNSFVWRDNTSRTLATDKIEFNDFPTGKPYITNVQAMITSAIANNPIPKSGTVADSAEMNELQDGGPEKLEVVIGGVIVDPQSSSVAGHKLKTWMLDDKFVVTTFPFGRFGLELQDNEIFDLNPGTARGYMLTSVQFIRDGEFKGKLSFVATLRFNGGKGAKTSGNYLWDA